MNNHIIQAIKPLKNNFGLGNSATALFLPIIAIEPLSWYLKGTLDLDFKVLIQLCAKFCPCCIATCATCGCPCGNAVSVVCMKVSQIANISSCPITLLKASTINLFPFPYAYGGIP